MPDSAPIMRVGAEFDVHPIERHSDRSAPAFMAILGGVAGLSLTADRSRRLGALCALAGAALLSASDTLARRRQRPDELRAEHAFWVFGLPFLVLHYRIRYKAGAGTVETDVPGRPARSGHRAGHDGLRDR